MPFGSRKLNLTIQTTTVATSEFTTSTSYTDLATTGPAVTITTGIVQEHMLYPETWERQNLIGGGNYVLMSIAIAGAAAVDGHGPHHEGLSAEARLGAGWGKLAASQSSGATHTAKYRVTGQEGVFENRKLTGVAL